MKKPLFDRLKSDLRREGGKSPKAIIAAVIFGAICVVFVFFGYSGKHNRIGTGAAAQVNSTLIPVADLRNETQRLEQMYAPMFGGQNMGEAQRQFLRQQALESLVTTELMNQGAQSAGVLVPDQEVRDVVVKDIPAFQVDGRFDRQRYLAVLEANRWTAGEFEDRIRKERRVQRFRRVLETAASPLQVEVQKWKALRETQRNVDFVKLDRTALQEKMKISDAELQKRLSDEGFAKKVQADFDANKPQYASSEEIRAQHILIKAEKGVAEAEQKALAKIQEIYKRAQKEDFGKLAAEFSEDTGSKVKKGDLGTFGRGRMVPEFETAAFSQKVGVVGEPVKTDFGYHLIKVNEHKPASDANFEKARFEIARKILANEAYEEAVKKVETALAAGDGAAVQKEIKDLGLTWQETGFFDLTQDTAPKLNSGAATELALQVNEKQPWPTKVARDQGSVFIVKWKAEKKDARSENDKWNETLARERGQDLLRTWVEDQQKSAHIERNTDLLSGAGRF